MTLCCRTANRSDNESGIGDDNAGSNFRKEAKTYSEMLEDEAPSTDNRDFFVHLAIESRMSQPLEIKVSEGDNLNKIKERMKIHASPDFDDVPAYRIELFESVERTEPLNALEMWKPNVSWGTKQQPLMVKVNPLITRVAAVSPWENSASKYVFCLYKSRCTHVPLVGHIILYILFSHKHSI